MEKLKKCFIVVMLLLQLPIYSATIAIPVDSGYCSGGIWLYPGVYPQGWHPDSIVFSTNMSLTFVGGETELAITPWYNFAIIFINNSVKNIAYKFTTSISKITFYPNHYPYYYYNKTATQTIGNPDTLWANARKFPNSLLPLDTVLDTIRNYPDSLIFNPGKWCFENDGPDMDWNCYGCGMFNNYNALIYVNCIDNRKMKIQIDSFKLETKNSMIFPCFNPPNPNKWIDSIHIHWAADSMGNGIFKEIPDKTINPAPITGNSFSGTPIVKVVKGNVEFNLLPQTSGIKSLQIFSLNGSRIAQWQNPGQHVTWNTQSIPAGIYLADAVFGDQQKANCRFVIRK